MTTNKPEVVAYVDLHRGHGRRYVSLRRGVDHYSLNDGDALIRLSDYEALQAEYERLEVEYAEISENLAETELRALKLIHQCSAHVELYRKLRDERDAIQAECEKLRKDAEATRKSVRLLNYLFARNIIAMQSAVIEWEKGKGAAAGMQWIWNTLFGPGQIPDEGETDAQAYFDREIEPLDAAIQEDNP